MRRRDPAAMALMFVVGFSVAPGSAPPAIAAPLWTITAAPTALTIGLATDVTLIVTAGNQPIGCVTVSVPAGYTVSGNPSVTSAPGGSWSGSRSGSAPTLATFSTSNSPADRLATPAQARFVIRVTATSAGLGAWTPSAFVNAESCSPSVGPQRRHRSRS